MSLIQSDSATQRERSQLGRFTRLLVLAHVHELDSESSKLLFDLRPAPSSFPQGEMLCLMR